MTTGRINQIAVHLIDRSVAATGSVGRGLAETFARPAGPERLPTSINQSHATEQRGIAYYSRTVVPVAGIALPSRSPGHRCARRGRRPEAPRLRSSLAPIVTCWRPRVDGEAPISRRCPLPAYQDGPQGRSSE